MSKELSVKEAAELTDYNEHTVYKLVQAGKVKARKVVSVWQIDKADLLRYVERMKQDPRGGPKNKS